MAVEEFAESPPGHGCAQLALDIQQIGRFLRGRRVGFGRGFRERQAGHVACRLFRRNLRRIDACRRRIRSPDRPVRQPLPAAIALRPDALEPDRRQALAGWPNFCSSA